MKLKLFCQPLQWGTLLHVMLQWRRCFRDEYNLMSRFLFPTDELATCYPGRDVPWDDGYRVVIHQNGPIVAIDDEDYDNRLTLTRADIIRHRFDLKRFRRETAACLGLKPDDAEIELKNRAVPWGVWEPEKGAAFPVRLLLLHFKDNFKEKLYEMILNRQAPGEIVLTPTRDDWKDGVEELARKNKLLLVPLDEILQADGDKILPAPEWNEYLTAFCKMVECDLPSSLQGVSSEPPFEFRKKGEMWIARFDGDEMFLKDSVGLQCIAQLLAKPNDPVFVMELRAVLNGQKAEPTSPPAREDVVDRATLNDLKRRYLELQGDLENARSDGNEVIEREAEQEMEKIVQYLCQVKSLGGETRKVNDEFEKARSATSKAFWRSVNLIRNDLPQFANHLEKTCVVGMVCNYTPGNRIDWVL